MWRGYLREHDDRVQALTGSNPKTQILLNRIINEELIIDTTTSERKVRLTVIIFPAGINSCYFVQQTICPYYEGWKCTDLANGTAKCECKRGFKEKDGKCIGKTAKQQIVRKT